MAVLVVVVVAVGYVAGCGCVGGGHMKVAAGGVCGYDNCV